MDNFESRIENVLALRPTGKAMPRPNLSRVPEVAVKVYNAYDKERLVKMGNLWQAANPLTKGSTPSKKGGVKGLVAEQHLMKRSKRSMMHVVLLEYLCKTVGHTTSDFTMLMELSPDEVDAYTVRVKPKHDKPHFQDEGKWWTWFVVFSAEAPTWYINSWQRMVSEAQHAQPK